MYLNPNKEQIKAFINKDSLSYSGLKRIAGYSSPKSTSLSRGSLVDYMISKPYTDFTPYYGIAPYEEHYTGFELMGFELFENQMVTTLKELGIVANKPQQKTLDNLRVDLSNLYTYLKAKEADNNLVCFTQSEKETAEKFYEQYRKIEKEHKLDKADTQVISYFDYQVPAKIMMDKVLIEGNTATIFDVKTTSETTVEGFLWSAKKYKYLWQAYWAIQAFTQEGYNCSFKWVVLKDNNAVVLEVPNELIFAQQPIIDNLISNYKQSISKNWLGFDPYYNGEDPTNLINKILC